MSRSSPTNSNAKALRYRPRTVCFSPLHPHAESAAYNPMFSSSQSLSAHGDHPLVMGCSASLSVVSQLLSVCFPSGFHGWVRPSWWMGGDLHFTGRNHRRGKVRLHCLGSNLAQPLHCRASSPSVFLFRHHPYKPCCTTASRVTASWHSLQITHCCSCVQVYCKHPACRWCAYHADSAAPGSWAAYHRSFARPGHSDQRLGTFP